MGQNLIVVDPKIMMGKPVIAGTRLTVELILEELGAGRSFEDLLTSYPHLTRQSILANQNVRANQVFIRRFSYRVTKFRE